ISREPSRVSTTYSCPWPSSVKLSVRKVAAGFASFSRNQAVQAFPVSRIQRTFSRARRIFCPSFPIITKFSRTRSLEALHPNFVRLEGSHGFTVGAVTGCVSQLGLSSSGAGVAGLETPTGFPSSFVYDAGPRGALARGSGSAAGRMNFVICARVSLPEKFNTNKRATARMLQVAEYIFFSCPDLQRTTDRPRRQLPDGRQPEAARRTVKPRSETKDQDQSCRANTPQTLLY